MRRAEMSLVALLLRRPLLTGTVATFLLMGLGLAVAIPAIEWRTSAAPAEAAADPAPLGDFALTDQEGRRVRLRDHLGKVLLVNFVTTRCTTVCVQVTRELRGLQQALGSRMGREVVFLSIGLDSRQDTPAALQRFARTHGVDFRTWAFLSGTAKELEAARRPFGALAIRASREPGHDSHEFIHTTVTYLADRRGVLRKKILPGFLTLAGLHEVETALASASEVRRIP